MHTRHATSLAPRGRLACRFLLVITLALVLTIGAAGAALAATGHAASGRPVPAETRVPTIDETAPDHGPSPIVPLVFAGIVFLAVAFPTFPRYPRSGYYSRGEHW